MLLGSLASTVAKPAPVEAARVWTPTTTGKGSAGTLVSKAPDNSTATIKLQDGREITVKTADLVKADREYVANWKGVVAEKEIETAAEPRGIVRGRMGGALSQSSGGKSRVMKDLQSVLSDYGQAENDAKAHPEALIYRGSALFPGGGEISIPYLMPRLKALALLVQRPGQASPRPALAPGFPPGMINYEYDIRYGVYNRLFVIVDQADQVVAIQIKSETRNDPSIPDYLVWKQAAMPMGSTSDFIEPRTGGATAWVLDLRANEKRIIIDLETPRMETVLFLPEPMIKLCLYHLSLDLRK
ncbi:MAG: hypothetical protein ACRCXD_01460 [Luteolibacter sp.]